MRSRWMVWVLTAGLAGLVFMAWPFIRPAFSGGAQAAASLLAQTGRWGPAVVVGLQVLQAVISPLPAWPVTVAAGALYGTFWATAYCLLGGAIGAAINFLLARRLGKEWIRRKFGEKWIDKAAGLTPIMFMVLALFGRLIPIASFDVVAYVAGISRISLPVFLSVAVLGQAPAFIAYAYFGSDLAAAQEAGIIGSLLMLLFAALIVGGRYLWQRLAG